MIRRNNLPYRFPHKIFALAFGLILILQVGCSRNIFPEESATEESLLEMTHLESLPVFKDRSYFQASSSQRPNETQPVLGKLEQFFTQGMPWFFGWPENYDANHFQCRPAKLIAINSPSLPHRYDHSSCEEDYIQGAVLARWEGSGIMTRMWLTQITRLIGLVPTGTIRLYIDNRTTPDFQMELLEMYQGKVNDQLTYPFGAASDNFIAWNYPISFNSKLIVTLDRMLILDEAYYYQINAVLNNTAQETPVATTKSPLRDEVIDYLGQLNFEPHGDLVKMSHSVDLSSTAQTIWTLPGPATVQRFSATFDEQDLDELNKLHLTIGWDQQQTESIDLKLMDLFSGSQIIPTVSNIILSTRANDNDSTITLNIDLPMPFSQQAVITLSSENPVNIPLELTAYLSTNDTPVQPWGYLSTQYNETLASTDSGGYHPFFTHTGRGRLVGICAQFQGQSSDGIGGRTRFSYLEGDEHAIIDGEERIVGTGTEDYFNSSFYFKDAPYSTPFAQNWGRTVDEENDEENSSACRWHLFHDAIDYQTAINFRLEIGAMTPAALKRYRTVAYYYTD